LSDGSGVSAADVKVLRDRTGAGIMDCKSALAEAGGDVDRAIEILRVKGQASAAKRSGRATGEGVVTSYIHATGRVGVLVEVQCETDFVAADEIPDDLREAERAVLEAKAREEGKPDDIIGKIVEGQLSKWSKELALLEQEHVRSDAYDGKTIEDLRAELSSKTGENVRVARFARFVVGE
jgi:elongation factor Ts